MLNTHSQIGFPSIELNYSSVLHEANVMAYSQQTSNYLLAIKDLFLRACKHFNLHIFANEERRRMGKFFVFFVVVDSVNDNIFDSRTPYQSFVHTYDSIETLEKFVNI